MMSRGVIYSLGAPQLLNGASYIPPQIYTISCKKRKSSYFRLSRKFQPLFFITKFTSSTCQTTLNLKHISSRALSSKNSFSYDRKRNANFGAPQLLNGVSLILHWISNRESLIGPAYRGFLQGIQQEIQWKSRNSPNNA